VVRDHVDGTRRCAWQRVAKMGPIGACGSGLSKANTEEGRSMTDPMRGETARAVSARVMVSEGEAKSTKVGLYSTRIGRRGMYGKPSKVALGNG